MDTLHDAPVISPQPPDMPVLLLASSLADRRHFASALSAYLPPPVLSGLEAHMSASITAATLKASS